MYKTCPVPFPSKSSCLGRLSVRWLVVRLLVCCSRVRSVFVACRGWKTLRTHTKAEVMFSTDIAHALLAQLQAEVNEHARAGFGLPIFLQVSCVEVVQLVCGLSLCAGQVALFWGTSGG